ncbi:hypothetical protein SAMN02746066_01672 [Anaerosporobacter mobilis DSM 15930]|uniref:Uncharacterized protein n=1 Tax=Anaerosporobacter mobilis DSM 15930 TaxID=1120996 RepID=A0A1M7I661_9FIRM|nr:hypothetical protein [Anaerosporobacter mobilis]SHM36023.1 hypothetical protein SAMN02746066_01672 [Anaerosporobacter mobilis DSM 15930]
MYTIGLIDDEESQLKAMRRTIKINAPRSVEYDFKSYSLSKESGKLVDEVFRDVMHDIVNEEIGCLIIDYKIMVRTTKIQGTEIFRKIKEVVPKFPIIILTEVVEESIEPDFIDADKVYRKRDFFKLEEEYSKDKVHNIFDSMRKYVSQRDSLKLTLFDLKEKLAKGNESDMIKEVLKVESEIADFLPSDQSQIDRVFDEGKVKKIVELIEKANNMLE